MADSSPTIELVQPEDHPTFATPDGKIWVYGATKLKLNPPRKVGVISKDEHCKPHVKALKGMGFKVKVLGSRPTAIPRSIHFVILRHESCSHGASDVALAWVRRSPETRTLAWASSVTGVKEAAEGYLTGFPGSKEELIETLEKKVTARLSTSPKRKKRKRPADFVPTPKAMPQEKSMLDSLTHRQRALYDLIAGGAHTTEELEKALDFPTTKAAHSALRRLKNKGVIVNVHQAKGSVNLGVKGYYVTTEQLAAGIPIPEPIHSHGKLNRALKALGHTEKHLYEALDTYGEEGCSIEHLRNDCKHFFGKLVGKSTIAGSLGKLRKAGLVVNVGGEGKGPVPGWYVHTNYTPDMEGRTGAAYQEYIRLCRRTKAKKRAQKKAEEETKQFTLSEPPKAPEPSPQEIDDPFKVIREETELLVMWMREWNIDSITLSRSGEVQLSGKPTITPKLEVTFVVPTV